MFMSVVPFVPPEVLSRRPAPATRRAWAAHLCGAIVVAIAAVAAGAPVARAGAHAAPRQDGFMFVRPIDMNTGALLFRTHEDGKYVEAPRLGADYDVTISGPTLSGRVTQMFHNPTEGWVEAVYVYPLSDGAAVDSLKMIVGTRVVVAEIKERQEARRVFEEAKAAGQKAALMEQERPNLFTNSVANIGPGETVVIELEYQEPVRRSGDMFSMRLPLVVGPRYSPPPLVQVADPTPGGEGWGTAVADPVPDREEITPPVLDPAVYAPQNPVTIGVRLAAGFPLGEVKSHHHAVEVSEEQDGSRVLRLASGGAVAADRDFELTWTPATATSTAPSSPGQRAPTVGLFRERVGDSTYLVGFVTPPARDGGGAEAAMPREVILVIDNSGSMGGTSMREAKASLDYALGRLRAGDRFNVVRFDNTHEVLHPDAVPASAGNVEAARRWVRRIEASGGTEMLPAMRAALDDRGEEAGKGHLRQVIFLTDGAIGNESGLLATIAAGLGRSRVYMVGIGSAPNTYLMARAAETGRGSFTHIGSPEQVEVRMRELFEKLESPVATGLTARITVAGADVTPGTLPDLHRGEPVVLAARLPGADAPLAGDLEIAGRIGDRPWRITVPLDRAAEGRGLSKLWARRKIGEAEAARTLRETTPEAADRTILSLALEHRLVTRLTSLVAVDRTPSRPEGTRLTRADVPLNLPAGWDFEKVFGERPRRSGGGLLLPRGLGAAERGVERADAPRPPSAAAIKVAGRAFQAVATSGAPRPIDPRATAVTLPKTATDAELRMLAGLVLLLLSAAVLAVRRHRGARVSL